ncbi:hypothetical protein ACQPW3_08050 [Actinosynnema sp. CA-248983]
MQFPHRFLVVTPTPVADAYDNPTPDLDYGPDAARRVMWGHLQPLGSTEPAEPGRRPVVTRWRLFTIEPVTARERIEWQGRVLDVDGEPDRFEPRFGLVHYETRLKHVEG